MHTYVCKAQHLHFTYSCVSNLGDELVVEIHKEDTHNHFNIQIILALSLLAGGKLRCAVVYWVVCSAYGVPCFIYEENIANNLH